MRLAALLLALATPLAAQEYVSVDRRLADVDFHRLVACAASPGGPCRKPMLRWPAAMRAPLTVGLVSEPRDLPAYKAAAFDAALEDVVAQVNAVGAGIELAEAEDDPDIRVHVVPVPPGGIVRGTGEPALDGRRLPLALVSVRLDARRGAIAEAAIAVSDDIRRREIAPVMLEEVVQALGLMTDVAGAPYHRSIFFEDGNSAAYLRGQDAEALRLHYPPGS